MTENNQSIVPEFAVASPEAVQRRLEMTPDKLLESKREQEKLLKEFKSLYGAKNLSPEEAFRARAIEIERSAGGIDGIKSDEVAEALALCGKFAEAARAAESDDLRRVYAERDLAVQRDDTDCPCDTSYVSKRGFLLPNQHVELRNWSLKHNREMDFIRCRACGELNAREILPHLAEQRQMRKLVTNGKADPQKAAKFFEVFSR
jgi:hypothetical protein